MAFVADGVVHCGAKFYAPAAVLPDGVADCVAVVFSDWWSDVSDGEFGFFVAGGPSGVAWFFGLVPWDDVGVDAGVGLVGDVVRVVCGASDVFAAGDFDVGCWVECSG